MKTDDPDDAYLDLSFRITNHLGQLKVEDRPFLIYALKDFLNQKLDEFVEDGVMETESEWREKIGIGVLLCFAVAMAIILSVI